ncbi:MAG TPA: hypothetical protein VM934_15260 [Pyrinomonadaceae bacterium]|nr:hypothetical protein [Pyrinomonadaceae bacterium]
MKRVFSAITSLVLLGCLLLAYPAGSRACSRSQPFTLNELFDSAEVIVRATAVRYAKPPANPNSTVDFPDSTIEFKVKEKLRGKGVPGTIILKGYLSDSDDFNEMPVPYMFVRPLGRTGTCVANTYKEGAEFLLFLQKTKDGYTSNISALGPTNEQLRSNKDEWLIWVRNHLKSLKKEGRKSALFKRDGLRLHTCAALAAAV